MTNDVDVNLEDSTLDPIIPNTSALEAIVSASAPADANKQNLNSLNQNDNPARIQTASAPVANVSASAKADAKQPLNSFNDTQGIKFTSALKAIVSASAPADVNKQNLNSLNDNDNPARMKSSCASKANDSASAQADAKPNLNILNEMNDSLTSDLNDPATTQCNFCHTRTSSLHPKRSIYSKFDARFAFLRKHAAFQMLPSNFRVCTRCVKSCVQGKEMPRTYYDKHNVGQCMKCQVQLQCNQLLVYNQDIAASMFCDTVIFDTQDKHDMIYVCKTCSQQAQSIECALCSEWKTTDKMTSTEYTADNSMFTFLRDACEKSEIDVASIPLFNVSMPRQICKDCKVDCIFKRIPRAILRVENDDYDQDTKNYIDALNNSLPLRSCSLCEELKGNKDMGDHVYYANDKVFNFLLDSGQIDVSDMPCFHKDKVEEPMSLCTRCQKSCWSKRIPRCITANGLTWGDIPECLRGLTWAEERCIAKYNCVTHICKLSGYQQHARVGGIVYLENDIVNIAESLPRSPTDCNIIVFQVNSKWGNKTSGSTYTWNVRKDKVISALEWLFDNHPSYLEYKEAGVNMSNLSAWEDQNLQQPIVTNEDGSLCTDKDVPMEFDCRENKSQQDCTNKTNLNGCDIEGMQDGLGIKHMVLESQSNDTDNIKSLAETLKEALDRDSQSTNKTKRDQKHTGTSKSTTMMKFPPHKGDALQTYCTEDLFEASFPCLFPEGKNGPKALRPLEMSLAAWDKHALMEKSQRFATHIPFLISRYMDRMTKQASQLAFVADKYGNNFTVSEEALRQACENGLGGASRNKMDRDTQEILERVVRFGGIMKSTYLEMIEERRKLYAKLGSPIMKCPTWFVTISNSDIQWSELAKVIYPEKSWDDVSKIPFLDRIKLLTDNPAMACRIYKERLTCILEKILKGSNKPLGELIDYWIRIEMQDRGSPHAHALLTCLLYCERLDKWYDGDEMCDMMLSSDETVKKDIGDMVDSYVSCSIPNIFIPHEKTDKNYKDNFGFRFDEELIEKDSEDHPSRKQTKCPVIGSIHHQTEIWKQIRATQCHIRKHTPSCFKYCSGKKSKRICRFGYPKPECKQTRMRLVIMGSRTRAQLRMVIKRNNDIINNYVPKIIHAIGTNMDAQFVPSVNGTAAYLTAGYASKADAPDSEMLSKRLMKIVADHKDKDKDGNELMPDQTRKKLYLASMAIVESTLTGAQQICWYLLGFPIVFTNRDVLGINTTPPSMRARMFRSSPNTSNSTYMDDDTMQEQEDDDTSSTKLDGQRSIFKEQDPEKVDDLIHTYMCLEHNSVAKHKISLFDFATRYKTCRSKAKRGKNQSSKSHRKPGAKYVIVDSDTDDVGSSSDDDADNSDTHDDDDDRGDDGNVDDHGNIVRQYPTKLKSADGDTAYILVDESKFSVVTTKPFVQHDNSTPLGAWSLLVMHRMHYTSIADLGEWSNAVDTLQEAILDNMMCDSLQLFAEKEVRVQKAKDDLKKFRNAHNGCGDDDIEDQEYWYENFGCDDDGRHGGDDDEEFVSETALFHYLRQLRESLDECNYSNDECDMDGATANNGDRSNMTNAPLSTDQANADCLSAGYIKVMSSSEFQMAEGFISQALKKQKDSEEAAMKEYSKEISGMNLGAGECGPEIVKFAKTLKCFNQGQKQAFNMIAAHLNSHESTRGPLRAFMSGEGGCGKSFLIHAIETYARMLFPYEGGIYGPVLIVAPTGKAALGINGRTICSTFHLLEVKTQLKKYKKLKSSLVTKLQNLLGNVKLVIIDEVSMLGQEYAGYMDCVMRLVAPPEKLMEPFGGVHLLCVGDFYQLDPIHQGPPLFSKESTKSSACDQGRSLFESLNTYINLTEQMRQLSPEDDAFRGFLSRARTGSVTMQDMDLINSKVRSKEQIDSLELDSKETLYVAPTCNTVHSVNQSKFNLSKSEGHASDVEVVYSWAHDDYKSKSLHLGAEEKAMTLKFTVTSKQKAKIQKQRNAELRRAAKASANNTDQSNTNLNSRDEESVLSRTATLFTSDMPSRLELRKGQRVVLTNNIGTTCGLANGSLGTIVGFCFDEKGILRNNDNPDIHNGRDKPLHVIRPACANVNEAIRHGIPAQPIVFVQFDRLNPKKTIETYPFVDDKGVSIPNVVPIYPIECDLCGPPLPGKKADTKLVRYQLPLESAWCLTIHKSQGCSIRNLIFMMEKCRWPGSRGIAYVACSRCLSFDGFFLCTKDSKEMFRMVMQDFNQFQNQYDLIRHAYENLEQHLMPETIRIASEAEDYVNAILFQCGLLNDDDCQRENSDNTSEKQDHANTNNEPSAAIPPKKGKQTSLKRSKVKGNNSVPSDKNGLEDSLKRQKTAKIHTMSGQTICHENKIGRPTREVAMRQDNNAEGKPWQLSSIDKQDVIDFFASHESNAFSVIYDPEQNISSVTCGRPACVVIDGLKTLRGTNWLDLHTIICYLHCAAEAVATCAAEDEIASSSDRNMRKKIFISAVSSHKSVMIDGTSSMVLDDGLVLDCICDDDIMHVILIHMNNTHYNLCVIVPNADDVHTTTKKMIFVEPYGMSKWSTAHSSVVTRIQTSYEMKYPGCTLTLDQSHMNRGRVSATTTRNSVYLQEATLNFLPLQPLMDHTSCGVLCALYAYYVMRNMILHNMICLPTLRDFTALDVPDLRLFMAHILITTTHRDDSERIQRLQNRRTRAAQKSAARGDTFDENAMVLDD